MRKNKSVAYVMLALSSIIFGFSFLFTKETLKHLETFQLLGNRFLIAAVIMTVLMLARLVKINISFRKIKGLLLIAIFQPLIYFICETYGVRLTSSSESGMMIALMPIAIALFSRIILKERLNIRQWAAVFVSVIGVGMIIGAKGFDMSTGSMAGYILLIAAVTAEGIYSPSVRKMTAHCSPYEITFVMMWVGAIVFNAIGLINAVKNNTINTYFFDILNTEVIAGILYLAVLSSIVAFFCINYALSKVNASKSASFANLTTVISVLAGTLIGGEQILSLQIAGMVLILLSIWGIVHDKKDTKHIKGKKVYDHTDDNSAQGGGFYPQV